MTWGADSGSIWGGDGGSVCESRQNTKRWGLAIGRPITGELGKRLYPLRSLRCALIQLKISKIFFSISASTGLKSVPSK